MQHFNSLFVLIFFLYCGTALCQGSGYLACGQNLTLNANGDPKQMQFDRVLEPTGMRYQRCPGGTTVCAMINEDNIHKYEPSFNGGVTVSNVPPGSKAQLVVYLNGNPTSMIYNLQEGNNYFANYQFSSQYYNIGDTLSLYVQGYPAGTGGGITVGIKPPRYYCFLYFEWNETT